MDPLTISTIIGALTQVGGQVLSFTAQSEQAKKQKDFAENYKNQVTKAAWEDFSNNANLATLKQDQQAESVNFDNQQSDLANRQAKATAEASALESGVSGNSIDSLLRGYDRATAINDYVSAKNIKYMGLQTKEEIKGLRARAINTINQAQIDPNSIIEPDLGANLLAGLNGAINGAASGYQIGKTFSKPSTGVQTI